MKVINGNVEVTGYTEAPFVILVTDQETSDDTDTWIVAPEGGFATKEAALELIEQFAKRKEPYLGLKFQVLPFRKPGSFIQKMSWED